MKKYSNRIKRILNSPRFFSIILGLFVLESIWIAVSAAYPQAFDENFHFGLIQVYSHYWLPFLSAQPPHANAFGAVARDPSYLYHYLLSFPYRIISHFDHELIGQVILLRFINIGLFMAGLVLFRRVLERVGMSRALANCSLLVFILIPIVPQLAAQINYDNLLIPLTAGAILLTCSLIEQIKNHKPNLSYLLGLLSLCLYASLVKYAFLPIFAGIVVFLGIISYQAYHLKIRMFLADIWDSRRNLRMATQIILAIVCLLSIGLFVQRDGINLIKYRTVAPDCSQILSVKDCSAYSPWNYNYINHKKVVANKVVPSSNLVGYSLEWVYWMWYRLFFAVNGPTSGFRNYPPLPLPSAAAILLATAGTYTVIKWRRKIFLNNVFLALLFVVSSFYILALFIQGYSTYRYTGVLENMNGRYLLPILLFVGAIVGRALSLELAKSAGRKVLFAVVIVLLFLQGGGALTFISRSDETWDVGNKTVEKINDTARHITNPVLVNGKTSYGTHFWLFN